MLAGLMTVSTLKIHLGAGLCALLLASCATVPPPAAELAAAQDALASAARADADQYAPQALAEARERLALAQGANAARRYGDARQRALEAEAAADLARAQSRLATARADVTARTRENEGLRQRLLDAERSQ